MSQENEKGFVFEKANYMMLAGRFGFGNYWVFF